MTENELLEAIREALGAADDPDGAYTMRELEDMTGRGAAWLRSRLRGLMRDGTVRPVKVERPNAWGDVRHEPAYQFRRAA